MQARGIDSITFLNPSQAPSFSPWCFCRGTAKRTARAVSPAGSRKLSTSNGAVVGHDSGESLLTSDGDGSSNTRPWVRAGIRLRASREAFDHRVGTAISRVSDAYGAAEFEAIADRFRLARMA